PSPMPLIYSASATWAAPDPAVEEFPTIRAGQTPTLPRRPFPRSLPGSRAALRGDYGAKCGARGGGACFSLPSPDYLVASATPNRLWLRSLAPRICSYSVDLRAVPRPRSVGNAAAGVLRRLCRKTNSSRNTWSWALLTPW